MEISDKPNTSIIEIVRHMSKLQRKKAVSQTLANIERDLYEEIVAGLLITDIR